MTARPWEKPRASVPPWETDPERYKAIKELEGKIAGLELIIEQSEQLKNLDLPLDSTTASLELIQAYKGELIRRRVRRSLDAEEYAEACGSRMIMKHDTLAAQPKPVWIKAGYFFEGGVFGLAGPPEAGKSLVARDWAVEVAAAGRPVLYMPTEGQFDMRERFEAHHLFKKARPYLAYFEGGFSFASAEDRKWLIAQFGDQPPVLIISDMIYGHGLPDDNGMKDVGPVLGGCRKVAVATRAGVIVTGHPPLSGERRFRGSSMWRGSFDAEFHMAGGLFTCEKHKHAEKKKIRWSYTVEFPHIRQLGPMESLGRAAERNAVIEEDLRLFPGDSDNARAKRLAPVIDLGESRARRIIADYKKGRKDG